MCSSASLLPPPLRVAEPNPALAGRFSSQQYVNRLKLRVEFCSAKFSGGEGGIRTHVPRLSGTAFRERRLKPTRQPLPSQEQVYSPELVVRSNWCLKSIYYSILPNSRLRTFILCYLRSLKKTFKIALHSFSRMPRSTFTLWFKPLLFNNVNLDSTAPNFGSSDPKTNLDILPWTIAETHMGQGSAVTNITVSFNR